MTVASFVCGFIGFSANIWMNPEFVQPKTIRTRREIFPQNYSSLRSIVLEELENKQSNKTNKQTNKRNIKKTDSLTSYCFRG